MATAAAVAVAGGPADRRWLAGRGPAGRGRTRGHGWWCRAGRFDQLRSDANVQAFLVGAGPAAISAILGSAVLLGPTLNRPWRFAALAGSVLWLLALRRGVVSAPPAGAVVGLFVEAIAQTAHRAVFPPSRSPAA